MDPPELQRVLPYMKNNEKMPDDVTEDLQRVLAEPRQELADLDAEIKELKDRLTQLKVKRDRIQKYIAQFKSVLSPIRRLPADILHDIFYRCLPTRRDPIMSVKEAPIVLTHICQTWRQIAHTSPLLWARLYITFSDEDLHSNRYISHESTQGGGISNTLRLRCIAIEEWLSRSRACPLSISLCYTSFSRLSRSDDRSPGNSEHTRTLFRLLARHSPRWQRLELRMPIEIYRMLEAMVPLSQLQMLKAIRTSFSRQIPAIDSLENEPTFWQAQNLKRISLDIYPSQMAEFTLSTPTKTKLTTLSISCTISITEAASLLKNCPNLEYAMLFAVSTDSVLFILPPGVISLPHLRAFSFTDAVHPVVAHQFYERIDAPQIEWLDYKREIRYFGRNAVSLDCIPIIVLLKRLTNLKKLTVTGNFILTSELRRMLRSAQSINHLVFGPEIRTNENSLGPLPTSDFGSTRPTYNLGDLFLKDNNEEIGYDLGLPLLPHLEILEISRAASKCVTNEALRAIILSRSNPLYSNGCALLKKVTVLCPRTEEMIEISRKLSTYAYTGQVELQLGYDLDQAPTQDMLFELSSPGYGIDEFDRSWPYKDIEEEMMFS